MFIPIANLRHHSVTFLIAALGVSCFSLLDLPLPWLLGPIASCLFAAVVGVPLKTIDLLNQGMRTILGVAVGSTFSLGLLYQMADLWQTLLFIPVMLIIIGSLGVPYFQRLFGFDRATSYYASMPGGLQDMVLFGQEAGADVRALSLIHATRLLIIVVSLPFLLKGFWPVSLSNPPGVALTSLSAHQLLLMLVCALVGWRIAKAVGLLGASLLGPLFLAAILSIAGILETRPPAEAIWLSQFFIGMSIGAHYSGITLAEIKHSFIAGFGFCIILIVLTFIFLGVIQIADLAPSLEALLAFAPGGQAELAVLTLIVGADVAFVIIHHVFRMILVIIGAPLVFNFLNK